MKVILGITYFIVFLIMDAFFYFLGLGLLYIGGSFEGILKAYL